MKLQDQFPYDETLLGLMGVYHSVGERSHFINSVSIQTKGKIIIIGKDFLIASTLPSNSKPIVHQITVIDVQHHDDNIYLFVKDQITSRIYIVNVYIDCPNDKCPWVIVEPDDIENLLDFLAVLSYCQGDDSKYKSHSCVEDHPQKIQDDLLEFDF